MIVTNPCFGPFLTSTPEAISWLVRDYFTHRFTSKKVIKIIDDKKQARLSTGTHRFGYGYGYGTVELVLYKVPFFFVFFNKSHKDARINSFYYSDYTSSTLAR
jgi:hypothetical protein